MKILILANDDVGLYQFRKELIFELLKRNKVYISLPYGKLVNLLKKAGCKFISTSVDRRGINPITDLKLLKKYFFILFRSCLKNKKNCITLTKSLWKQGKQRKEK